MFSSAPGHVTISTSKAGADQIWIVGDNLMFWDMLLFSLNFLQKHALSYFLCGVMCRGQKGRHTQRGSRGRAMFEVVVSNTGGDITP